MKKLSAIMMSALFLIFLSACGTNDVGSMSENGSTPKKDDSIVSSVLSNSTDDITQSTLPDNVISREKALDIALAHAKLDKNDVKNIDVDFDRERGGYEWEVDFDHGGYEYSYDIDADSGEIIRDKKEIDD